MKVTHQELEKFEIVPILELKHCVSQYQTVTDMVAKLKQRIWLYNGNDKEAISHLGYFKHFEEGKNELIKIIRRILNAYKDEFTIWHEWLKPGAFGIGPALAGQFIVKLGYKFNPVLEACPYCKGKGCGRCKDTGKKKKAPPEFIIERREFPNVSSIWHFCGVHTVWDEERQIYRAARRSDLATNGIERQVGSGWSTDLLTLLYLVEDQFVKHGKFYREIYDKKREEINRKHPEGSCQSCKEKKLSHKKHQNQMARRETAKMWLSHWYTVSRTLAGLPVRKPYAQGILKHDGFIKPPYFDREIPWAEE